MGKSKPTVPLRRVGVHFADLTVRRTVFVDVRRSDGAGTAVATESSALWPPAVAAEGTSAGSAGVSPPLPSTTTATSSTATMPHTQPSPTAMHTIHHSNATANAPHLQHAGKPAVPTVSFLQSENGGHQQHIPPAKEETVTITVAELEAWKQRTIMQIEDHFTNEQLKRIAEFGRVHANLVKEAKEYVASIEAQLKEQFERERASLTRQAETYVAQFQHENDQLRQRVAVLEEELEDMQLEDEEEELVTTDIEAVTVTATPEVAMEGTDSGSQPVVLNGTVDSGSDSTDSSMANHSPKSAQIVDKQTVNAIRVDAVAERMSRAMEIETSQQTVLTVLSPVTTNESSPINVHEDVP